MERRKFFRNAGAVALTAAGAGVLTGCAGGNVLKSGEILHTVQFDLKYPVGSAESKKFLDDGKRILTSVPGVFDFQVFRQCSPKNDFQYAFYMKFASKEDFDAYTAHPDHCQFVKERWDTEVVRFEEADFQIL